MNHERFERLLLSDSPLSATQQEDLARHLAGCRACAALSARWPQVESVLASGLMLGPQPGFADRWVSRRSTQAAAREHRQAWRLFEGTSIAASSLAVLLGLAVWQASGSLPTLFADVLQQGLRLWIWARLLGGFTQAIATSVPTPVAAGAVLGTIGLIGGAGLVAALGSFSIIRFSFQGVRK